MYNRNIERQTVYIHSALQPEHCLYAVAWRTTDSKSTTHFQVAKSRRRRAAIVHNGRPPSVYITRRRPTIRHDCGYFSAT